MKKSLFFLLIISVFSANSLWATHLSSGEISYELIDESNFTYKITIKVYTDAKSKVLVGEGVLDFGDGTSMMVPLVDSSIEGPNVGYAEYSVTHQYNTLGNYIMSYAEANRNESVINIKNSVNMFLYLETFIAVRENMLVSEKSPAIQAPALFYGQYRKELNLSLAAKSGQDLKLRYELVPCKQFLNKEVDGYFIPQGVSVDHITGLFTWMPTADDAIGEYNFALKIAQFAWIEGEYQMVGYMVRDFQIILKDVDGAVKINADDVENLDAKRSLVLEPKKRSLYTFMQLKIKEI
ncbi:hypothetical protein [Fulvivirga sediminis]|uniref:Uncharacterized protein n=1 Tax=Fulvivirga sediminis TaxID=2803949 RepID=A0A937F1W8_9BACT|nr:hypothetical protein [Fulvivirga sediminis]MBL3654771.1 hypothetical protein [Fulvivirga sediminis]